MKKIFCLALTLVLGAALFTGCGCTNTNKPEMTMPTTMPATTPTVPPTRPTTVPTTEATRPTTCKTSTSGNGKTSNSSPSLTPKSNLVADISFVDQINK